MDTELLLKLLAAIISVIVLLKGIYEYKKAQRWKKLEFVSKEVKEFFADRDVSRALLMLDWNANTLPLYSGEIEERKELPFSDRSIHNAFRTHQETSTFSKEEVVIKKIFDTFFSKLSMFENYIETGLIAAKDIQPYLKYWIQILADQKNARKNTNLRIHIWKYIDYYGYEKVRTLCYRKEFS